MLNKIKDILRKKVGVTGEDFAAAYLWKRGLRVIEKNFRSRCGEIDLIALDRDTICFVEVKTRRSLTFGEGSESVIRHKQRKIIKTAFYYLKCKNWDERDFRFDVISILVNGSGEPQIEHFENAFEGF